LNWTPKYKVEDKVVVFLPSLSEDKIAFIAKGIVESVNLAHGFYRIKLTKIIKDEYFDLNDCAKPKAGDSGCPFHFTWIENLPEELRRIRLDNKEVVTFS
jgi:hypothetical protein